MKWVLILFFLFICCNNKNTSSTQPNADSARVVKTAKPKRQFKFISVSLFTIDPSFYNQPDTIVDFSDGKHAYENFFGGSAFIDSAGRPIHNRYKRYNLTAQEIRTLKNIFLPKLCFGYKKMCMPTFRDVLIFYDSSGKVLAQTPICFRCSEVFIYPVMSEICDEPNLDFKDFKQFISNIKSKYACL